MTTTDLQVRLEKVRAELMVARARRDRAAIAYASTPDGMAETVRRWELASPDENPGLAAVVAAGVAAADEEYLTRLVNSEGTPADTDGLLRALLLPPAGDPVGEVLAAHRVMGTFRQSDKSLLTGVTRVSLLRLTEAGERVRATVTYSPALLADQDQTTLADVVRSAASRPGPGRERLRQVLGPVAASALDEALS